MDLQILLNKSKPRLANVHHQVKSAAEELICQAHAQGILVLITQGLRTNEQQAEIYAQGRTKPGNIVSYAKPGYSYHNYGLAVDYCLLDANGKAVWAVTDQWSQVAQIAKSLGFEWGGDWTDFKDYPHLQMTFGLSIRQLLAGQRPKSPVPVHKAVDSMDNKRDIHILFNGHKLQTKAEIRDGRAYIPVRAFAEEIGDGNRVGWNGTHKQAILAGVSLTTTVIDPKGNSIAWVHEIGEALHKAVGWDGDTRTVTFE
jgi:peptidoglycan LD-endopeptidase CwlK